jgi:MFS family permease
LTPEKRSNERREPLFPGLFGHVQRGPYLTVVATYFLLIAGFSVMTAVFALYVANRHGFDEKQTGYLFAMLGVIGVVVQGGLIGRLVKKFGEAMVATAGSLFLVGGLFGAPLSAGLGGLLLACAGIALGNSLMSPTLSGIASRCVDEQWQGRARGVMQSGGSLARFLGPVAGGWLLTFDLGKPLAEYAVTPFWAAAGIVLLTFFLCLRLPVLPAKTK